MPQISVALRRLPRRWIGLALSATAALAGVALLPASALASHTQLAIIQDGGDLVNAPATMQQFRELGANTVRVVVPWAQIAPSPTATKKPNFNATDPNAYPAANWAPFDAIDRAAQQYGLKVYFDVSGGAPRWAEAGKPQGTPNESPIFLAWKPNAAAYGQFVQAMGKRYSGSFTPQGQSSSLPGVHFWSIFNEPNFGDDLGPQAIDDSRVAAAPAMFRSLLSAGWNALHATGHGRDTIIWGELAAQGFEPGPFPKSTGGLPGNYGQTRPLLFLRDLYCVNTSFKPLRGSAAAAVECPTTNAAARNFRKQNPALFSASGVADHPYPQTASPVGQAGNKVDYATFPDLGNFQSTLDRTTRAYGAGKKFPIYNTEYGYITNPPHPHYLSPATAAYYINWAEYLSYKQPSLMSYMQYLLKDPTQATGVYAQFASGLEFANGTPKATYGAYRLPVYMPQTSFSHTANEEIWGDARPAPFMSKDGDGPQTVAIQLNGKTIKTVTITGSTGYFDIRLKFPGSGSVRLAYKYPQTDSFLPVSALGQTVYSRSFNIKVH
ncbi:MAG TPA: hypothetical protein VHX62_03770 [Solirubrobacteraceae bacterium]|jgi:hypothetical protein|nr:hypothetical protein [Solirubrobacteraceae bacterium]